MFFSRMWLFFYSCVSAVCFFGPIPEAYAAPSEVSNPSFREQWEAIFVRRNEMHDLLVDSVAYDYTFENYFRHSPQVDRFTAQYVRSGQKIHHLSKRWHEESLTEQREVGYDGQTYWSRFSEIPNVLSHSSRKEVAQKGVPLPADGLELYRPDTMRGLLDDGRMQVVFVGTDENPLSDRLRVSLTLDEGGSRHTFDLYYDPERAYQLTEMRHSNPELNTEARIQDVEFTAVDVSGNTIYIPTYFQYVAEFADQTQQRLVYRTDVDSIRVNEDFTDELFAFSPRPEDLLFHYDLQVVTAYPGEAERRLDDVTSDLASSLVLPVIATGDAGDSVESDSQIKVSDADALAQPTNLISKRYWPWWGLAFAISLSGVVTWRKFSKNRVNSEKDEISKSSTV